MTSPRARADACPGALQTHPAADGELARVRVPGGLLTAGQLHVLAAAVADGSIRPGERVVFVHTGGLPGLFGHPLAAELAGELLAGS
jgi:hypothetical protein